MNLGFLFGSTGRTSDCEAEGPGFNPSTGNFLTALCLPVYSQIVCKVCPQIFSETTQGAEFIFSTYLQLGLYLVPIEFDVNW